MISPTLSSLFCSIILVANFGRIYCQDNPEGISHVPQKRSDLRDEPDHLDQLMGKLNKMDQRLTQTEKRQNETQSQLKNISVHNSHVEKQLTKIVRSQAEKEIKLATLTSSLHEMKWRIGVMEDSFAQTESPFVLDATTLTNGRGAIVFDGNVVSARKRRFWVLEKASTVKFTLDKNDLKADSRLTLSGFKIVNYKGGQPNSYYVDEVFINSSTATETEFTVSGVVILVTMTCNKTLGTREKSSFVLRFLRSRNDTVFPSERTLYPSSFVTGEGRQVVSFPQGNAVDYENNANYFMLISHPSEREFNLTRTFMDCEKVTDFVVVFQIKDEAEQTSLWSPWIDGDRRGRGNWSYIQLPFCSLFLTHG